MEQFLSFMRDLVNEEATCRKGCCRKPILSKDFISRAQVDLMDFQSSTGGLFQYALNYQNHFRKFCTSIRIKEKYSCM